MVIVEKKNCKAFRGSLLFVFLMRVSESSKGKPSPFSSLHFTLFTLPSGEEHQEIQFSSFRFRK